MSSRSTLNTVRAASLACASALLLLTTGCGSGGGTPTGPGALPPEGAGSATLLVDASVEGSDVGPGVFGTSLTVTLTDTAGAPVVGASVQIGTPTGTLVLVEDSPPTGTYRASRAGYVPGTYTLAVSRGSDWISGVRVVAPEIHSITSPAPNDTVPAGQGLTVTWSRFVAAQEATVESHDYESPAPEPDDGQSVIPAPGNPARDDQRVRVFRLNRTTIAGGRPGSQIEAEIRNSTGPVIAS